MILGPPNREYKDPAPITVLVGSSVRIEREETAGAVPPTPSPHLRDRGPTAVASVLGHPLKRVSCWRSLHYQHWRHENGAPWAAGWWQTGHEVEVRRTAGGLGRHRADAPLLRPSVRPESHSFRADQQASQWSYTIDQHKLMSRAVTFARYRKQSGASPLVEEPIHGFCDGSSNLNQVEGW